MSPGASERALRIFARNLAGEGGGVSLDALCQRHPELEAELRELERRRLEAGARAPLDGPHARPAAPREATVPINAAANAADPQVGPAGLDGESPSRYVLLGDVARGGMGVILHVWDTVLRRPLAMKVLEIDPQAEGSESASRAVARFLEEAQVAGQLEHPGVVPIHDLGRDTNGRVYFTMPLIEGRDLNQVFDLARDEAEGWSLTRALGIMTRVCEVVAYAHSRDLIHRDLKPANVMVGKFGETYVIDWGLAKSVGAPEPEGLPTAPSPREVTAPEGGTQEGTVLGTPAYMAPEQADGHTAEASFATDVYAIGALLYRLLAGRSPYTPRRGQEDAARTLELVRRGPPTSLSRIAPSAPAELVAISEKAMARRSADRYASVAELAGDLHAFLEGRVVDAYERGFWAETKKFMLRNRFRAGMIGALVFTAFAAMGVVTWVHTRVNQELTAKNVELQKARAQAVQSAREERDLRAGALHARYVAEVMNAATSLRVGEVNTARRTLEQCTVDERGFEWAHLWLGTDGSLRNCRVEAGPDGADRGAPLSLAYGPATGTFFAGYSDGRVRAWDIETGEVVRTLEGDDEPVIALAQSPDGKLLASASVDGRLRVYETDAESAESPESTESPGSPGSPESNGRLLEVDGRVASLAFDPRGTRIAAGTEEGSLLLLDLAGPARRLASVNGKGRVCFAAEGTRLVCAEENGTLLVLDPDTGAELARLAGHRAKVTALAAHAGSTRFASADEQGSVRVWDAETGQLVEALGSAGDAVTALTFHPSGARIASGDGAGKVCIWDLTLPSLPLVLSGHEAGITAVEFDAGGKRLVSASWDHALRIWNSGGPVHVSAYRAQSAPLRCAAFAEDGARVLLGSSDGFVILYDALRDELVRSWTAGASVTDVSFLDGDRRVAAGTLERGILTWDIAADSDEPLVLEAHQDSVYGLAVSDGRLMSASGDGTLRVWDGEESRSLDFLSEEEGPVLALSVAPRAGRVAASSADGHVRVGSIASGELVAQLGETGVARRAIALHPGGETLAWADEEGRLELVELPDGETRWSRQREDLVVSLAWSPDGDRLAAGTASGAVEVWDPRLGERLLSVSEHPDAVHEVAFDPAGERLLSVSTGGGLRILESTGQPARSRAQAQTGALTARSGALVEQLFAEALAPGEVLRRASTADDLTPQERELAVRLARSSVYGVQRMARESQAVVIDSGASLADYQSALERLREVSKLVPGDPVFQSWVGAALVRTGDPEAAIELLERVQPELGTLDRLRSQAFIALARCAAAQTASARELYEKLAADSSAWAGQELRALRLELEGCLAGGERQQE